MTNFYVVVLMTLLPLSTCIQAKQDCEKLRLFNDTGEVFDFTCNDHDKTDSCKNGRSSFPANLSVGMSVGKPRDFQVNVFSRNFSEAGITYLASGMVFKWKVPIEENSRNETKGYYLKINKAGAGSYECRLFDLRGLELTSPKMEFSYEMFPFNNAVQETYWIELFSLPLPSDIEYEEGLYVRHDVSLPQSQDYSSESYPADWTTWIELRRYPEEAKVQVEFGYPKPGSDTNFTSFKIQLIPWKANNELDSVLLNKTSASETVGRYSFSNIPDGTYYVKIRPYDPYRQDLNSYRCLCWYLNRRGRKICTSCQSSSTSAFNFTRIKHTPATTTESPDTAYSSSVTVSGSPVIDSGSESNSMKERTDESDSSTGMLAGIAAGCMASLAVLGVCYFVWKQRKPHQHQQVHLSGEVARNDSDSNNCLNREGNKHSISLPSFDTIPSKKERIVPELKTKTVLLLASEDHRHFRQALLMFARFLKIHCWCDVMFAPQQMATLRNTVNSYCWLSAQIDSADFVIIVASKAALLMYVALQRGNVYKEADFGPEGDLFTPGIQHICGKIARNESVCNVMMVHFDHTSPDLRLPIAALPSRFYRLPRHLDTFLLHIHGLDENSMDLSQVTLPLQGNVEVLAGGKEWLTAIHQSLAFEKLHPDWFEHKFGKPMNVLAPSENKTEYYQHESVDSGIALLKTSISFPRCPSSVSIYAGHAKDELINCDAERTQCINKDDFVAPSELLTDENSAVTVPFSACMLPDRPAEIDGGSSLTEHFHKINEHYEQEQQEMQDNVPEKETLIMCDQTCSHNTEQFPFHFQTHTQSPASQKHISFDGESLSSAQSV